MNRKEGLPALSDQNSFRDLCDRLAKLTKVNDVALKLSPDATAVWTEFQRENRKKLLIDGFGAAHEAHLTRLNGRPNRVLKLASLFTASLWAEIPGGVDNVIYADTARL